MCVCVFVYSSQNCFSLIRKKSSEGTYDLPHWDRTGTLVKRGRNKTKIVKGPLEN